MKKNLLKKLGIVVVTVATIAMDFGLKGTMLASAENNSEG